MINTCSSTLNFLFLPGMFETDFDAGEHEPWLRPKPPEQEVGREDIPNLNNQPVNGMFYISIWEK
jgi:hypothetical protein